MDSKQAIIIAIISCGGVTAIVNAVIELIKYLAKKNRKHDDELEPIRVGVRLLLQERIEHNGKQWIAAGEIPYSKLKYMNAAHDCYHNGLGGNGDLNSLMEDVRELQVDYTK